MSPLALNLSIPCLRHTPPAGMAIGTQMITYLQANLCQIREVRVAFP